MSDFDYGNARLRGAKARLLPRDVLATLAASHSLEELFAALSATPYRPAVESALAQDVGLAALSMALRIDLETALHRQSRWYQGKAAALLDWWRLRYDVYNVRTILRGVSRGAPAAAIVAQTMPVGALQDAELKALAGSESSVGVTGLLATYRSPLAQPLLALAATQPGASLSHKEVALLNWWTQTAWALTPAAIWRAALIAVVNSENILTALRLVQVPISSAQLVVQWISVPQGAHQLLDEALLAAMAGAPDLATAVSLLPIKPFGELLKSVLELPGRHPQPSAFEVALNRHRVRQAPAQIARDPLGIGVPLGYTELKINESRNLRLIGQGVFLGLSSVEIVDQLITA